ncbi:FFLEELY motif protein [Rugamonas sp. DEMB1]|uniref:FFLEELY motif protein n=1 Tax=Rugamonas sp. DEMB1 TaxID=3039386 RepID=UPI0024474613|nr:hypothetical protein [Rugamonas sp. DEMB1]WGG48770.1 hypothetical protein QC826_19210 [Rugamonas sp. DEMB1]
MRKEQLVQTLEEQLRTVKAERQSAMRDPALLAARTALKQFQSGRLAASHADLLAAPDSGDAALFFLDELYGAHDLGRRDADLERIIPTLQRVLPLDALRVITEAIVLDALSERLDTAMARALGERFDQAGYLAAYRATAAPAERERQLALVQALGESLCALVKVPFLSATLGVMRGPARLAGLGELQRFLERGFGAFKKMKQAGRFVDTIVGRERQVMRNIYAGAAEPFAPD